MGERLPGASRFWWYAIAVVFANVSANYEYDAGVVQQSCRLCSETRKWPLDNPP